MRWNFLVQRSMSVGKWRLEVCFEHYLVDNLHLASSLGACTLQANKSNMRSSFDASTFLWHKLRTNDQTLHHKPETINEICCDSACAIVSWNGRLPCVILDSNVITIVSSTDDKWKHSHQRSHRNRNASK